MKRILIFAVAVLISLAYVSVMANVVVINSFEESEFIVEEPFIDFWEANYGMPYMGYPISGVETTVIPGKGKVDVQYFLNGRIEHHPENAGTPYEFLLSDLGRAKFEHYVSQIEPEEPRKLHAVLLQGKCEFFVETSRNVCGNFLEYWESTGIWFGDNGVSRRESIALYGFPLSPMLLTEGKVVQYFERAIFLYDPRNGIVELEPLGLWYYEQMQLTRELH